MSRFKEGLRIIPRVVWVVAIGLYLVAAALLFFIALPSDPNMRLWASWQRLLFAGLVPLVLIVWILLDGFVYADAKRRGMRYVMWTLLAVFVPNAIGIILYFLLRDPLPVPCPKCGSQARGNFAYCPHCGAVLAPACPSCRRPVELDWGNCAFCGAKLEGQFAPASWLSRKLDTKKQPQPKRE